MALHKNLTDSELHESKGAATAAAGTVPVANGTGGATWQAPPATPPTVHASTHASAGSDPVTVAESQVTGLATDLAACEKTANKNAASGYAGLDASSKLTGSQQVYGSAANTACQGNDSRLSDARPPTSHATSHKNGGADEVGTATAAANAIPKAGASGKIDVGWVPTGNLATTVCLGNDARLSDARTPTSHAASHNAGGADALAIDAAAATGSLRTLGTAATAACAGNDSRLSNTRTPTAHASTHQPGGADAMAVDAAAATGSLRTLGTGAAQACAGNDSRLADDRTASGLRSATTVVATGAAAAPTAGQVLTATGGNAASWQTPTGSSVLKQTAFAEVAADTTTTSTTFVDLLSITLTTGANPVIISAAAHASNTASGGTIYWRLMVDGAAVHGGSMRSNAVNSPGSVNLIQKTAALTAASHTIKLQWRVSGSTGQVRPVASPDGESASLLVEEVSG